MPSVMSRLVVPTFLKVARRNANYVDADRARQHVAAQSVRPAAYGPPKRLRTDVTITLTHDRGWPTYTVAPSGGTSRGGLVYAHGGGWVNEIAPQHWQLCAQIAADAQLTVTLPIYPLVPFGTAEPVAARFAELVRASIAKHGTTFLAGDSAGGQIALSTALLLRDTDQLALRRTVLIAPGLDLSLNNPEIDVVQPTDPWLGRPGARVFAEHWRGDLPIEHPLVSPLFGDLTGLGPITMFNGTRDILTPDARLLAEKAAAAGVDMDFHLVDGLVHVYPLTPTPEGAAARRAIVEQLRADLQHPR